MNENQYILGISAFYHDSAAALVIDGEIIAAAQEERFTRKKHDQSYPTNAVNYVLKSSEKKLSDFTPFLKQKIESFDSYTFPPTRVTTMDSFGVFRSNLLMGNPE